jgi:hypothetical protein
MKLIASTAAAAALLVASTQAQAGALIFEPPVQEEIIVAEPAPAPAAGPNLAWIIPVIGLAAIAYAIASD